MLCGCCLLLREIVSLECATKFITSSSRFVRKQKMELSVIEELRIRKKWHCMQLIRSAVGVKERKTTDAELALHK